MNRRVRGCFLANGGKRSDAGIAGFRLCDQDIGFSSAYVRELSRASRRPFTGPFGCMTAQVEVRLVT
jgi:hypothetical protein